MVGWVQDHLEAIYGIQSHYRASEFLLTSDDARRLGSTGRLREELLIREEDGELWLGLCFAPNVNDALQSIEAPGRGWVDSNLDTYCQIAEGVSHFLYMTYVAAEGRQVSLLELEAQAEIDKFASCVLHGWDGGERWADEIHRRLFDKVSFDPSLSALERWRYQEANRLSRYYCARLLPEVASRRMDKFLAELRFSYRLGAAAKLRYLANTA
jgi:hypothetical protein